MRGIRGAITIEADSSENVLAAVDALLAAICSANPALQPGDIASAIFTVTEDIRSAFPAQAARRFGWSQVPMICTREIPVPGSLPLCVRLLVHWNTDLAQGSIQHVYLRGAQALRPDWALPETTQKA